MAALTGCSGGFGDTGVVLDVRSDGREELRFDVGRCGSDRAGFEVEQLDDRVVIEVSGPWNDGDDCSWGGDFVLDQPLGDRVVVLSGPGTRHARCDGAPEGIPQTLCQDDETEFSTWAPPRADPPRPDVVAAELLTVEGSVGERANPCPFQVALRLSVESHVDASITHRVLLVELHAEVFDWPADEQLDIGQPTWSQSNDRGALLDDMPADELAGASACGSAAGRSSPSSVSLEVETTGTDDERGVAVERVEITGLRGFDLVRPVVVHGRALVSP